MNAAVVSSFQSPPRYVSFTVPVAGDGEVLITVSAVGLHQIVKSLASGAHYMSAELLPFIAGIDGTGRLEDGTRVYFGMSRPPFGTLAEHCVTTRSMCLDLPTAVDDVTVAAMMNPGMSSWAALLGRAQFVSGESILILGATGMAGQLAVQIAKRLGARRIVAAGRNPEALEALTILGADSLVSLDQSHDDMVAAFRREWDKDGIDVVLDYVWGLPAERLLAAISQKGLQHASGRIRYIQVGSMAGANISLPAATLRSTGLELLGSGFGSVSIAKVFESLAQFLQEASKQPFQIKTKSAPLSDVEKLWNAEQGGARLVFRP
jgi:NADPH:quinone reductase-like Zn-dependent oxidoreductase